MEWTVVKKISTPDFDIEAGLQKSEKTFCYTYKAAINLILAVRLWQCQDLPFPEMGREVSRPL